MAKGRATVQKKAERLQESGQWEPYEIHRFMITSSLEKPFKITKSSQFSKDGRKVLLLERKSPLQWFRLGLLKWGAALHKEGWAGSWTRFSRAPWLQRRPTAFRAMARRSRQVIFHLYSALVTLLLEHWAWLWVPQAKKATNRSECREGLPGWSGAGAVVLWGSADWGTGAWRRGLGTLTAAHPYLQGWYWEGWAQLLTVRRGGKMRGNGHKSQQENMVQLDIGTNVTFFTTGFVRTLTFVGRSCDYFGFYLVTHKPIKEPWTCPRGSAEWSCLLCQVLPRVGREEHDQNSCARAVSLALLKQQQQQTVAGGISCPT